MPTQTKYIFPSDIALKITSSEDMDTVCHWMENRFIGLPHFHESIDLKVIGHKKISTGDNVGAVYQTIKNQTAPHLVHDLASMLEFIAQQKGKKSFGLLQLKIKLVPSLLNDLLAGEYNEGFKKNLFLTLGTRFYVPVTLALASVRSNKDYISLATGIQGISHYSSALQLSEDCLIKGYLIKAGIQVSAKPSHIDNRILRKIAGSLIDQGIINKYLKTYLIPEKKQIVSKLGEYVFNGCTITDNLSEKNIPIAQKIAPTIQIT